MQMYKVEFRSHRGSLLESGVCLVCASTAEMAEAHVAAHLQFPPSTAVFDTSRVKPSIYELSRKEHNLVDAIPMLKSAEQENSTGAVHEMRVSAKVFAFSESAAMRRLAVAIVDTAAASKSGLSKHVNELSVEIERADHRPRPSRVEEQAIYKEVRLFPGGAARPR